MQELSATQKQDRRRRDDEEEKAFFIRQEHNPNLNHEPPRQEGTNIETRDKKMHLLRGI